MAGTAKALRAQRDELDVILAKGIEKARAFAAAYKAIGLKMTSPR